MSDVRRSWRTTRKTRDAHPPRPNVVILNPPTAWRPLRGRMQTLTVSLGYCCTAAVHGEEAFEKWSGRRDLNPRPLDPPDTGTHTRGSYGQVSLRSVVRTSTPRCAWMHARCCTRVLYSIGAHPPKARPLSGERPQLGTLRGTGALISPSDGKHDQRIMSPALAMVATMPLSCAYAAHHAPAHRRLAAYLRCEALSRVSNSQSRSALNISAPSSGRSHARRGLTAVHMEAAQIVLRQLRAGSASIMDSWPGCTWT